MKLPAILFALAIACVYGVAAADHFGAGHWWRGATIFVALVSACGCGFASILLTIVRCNKP